MKGLKKIALASAIAAVSAGAQAELKALDDSAMGELTGQAGLTIDLDTKYTIGEFMYKDAGSVFFKGISLGGNTSAAEVAQRTLGGAVPDNGLVDNIRIKLDIAGAGESLDTGFSRVRDLAAIQAAAAGSSNGNAGELADFQAAATGATTIARTTVAAGLAANANNGVDASGDLTIGDEAVYDDGDLLIHVSFRDAWQKAAPGGLAGQLAAGTLGTLGFDQVLGAGLKSVDFNFSIDAIGLAASTVDAGDTIGRTLDGHKTDGLDSDGTDTTVLISDLSINGYLGPVDIHIENDGNGFSKLVGIDPGTGAPVIAQGIGDADSKIIWNTYVNVTDLDVYLDIAGVQITDMKINNVRGDVTDLDGNFAFGFAQSKREIYAVRNAAGFDTAGLAAAAAGATAYGSIAAALEALGNDGVAINTRFKGDMEIGALSFGDTGTSIGSLYWTDIDSTTNWTISAH